MNTDYFKLSEQELTSLARVLLPICIDYLTSEKGKRACEEDLKNNKNDPIDEK